MRRILVLFFTCIFMLSSVFAGGAKEDQPSAEGGLSGTLTVATNASSPTYDAVEHIVELFMEKYMIWRISSHVVGNWTAVGIFYRGR